MEKEKILMLKYYFYFNVFFGVKRKDKIWFSKIEFIKYIIFVFNSL